MKKTIMILFALSLAAYAQEPVKVKVTGDRVSLRAEPKPDAVLLDRATTGNELILKDNSNPDWVGVAAPESVDCWVHSEYIRDGKVVPELLNVRSGPSLSHSVIGILTAGASVTVRGQVQEWLRIAPPPEVTVWISRQYAEVIEPPPPAEPSAAEAEIQTASAPEPVPAGPAAQEVITALADVAPVPAVLTADPDKEQGVIDTFSGVLRPTQSVLYKLVDADVNEIILCYVRGNRTQMEAYALLPLRITGAAYWAAGLEMPVVVPSKIEILSE